MFRSQRAGAAAALALAGLGNVGTANAGIPVYNTIALSGATGVNLGYGPNQGPGLTFNAFTAPVLNQAGEIAFYAELAGPGINIANDAGIWAKLDGTLTTVARAGSAGPGPGLGGGLEFSNFGTPNINDSGEIVFGGTLMGPGVNNDNDLVQASTVGGMMSLHAREGSTTLGPGLGPGIEFGLLDNQRINDAGKIAFEAELRGPGIDFNNADTIWTISPGGSPVLLARAGSTGPGPNLGPGVHFHLLNGVRINPAGQVAFTATLAGSGIGAANDDGMWTNVGGALAPVARSGSSGPGPNVGAGINFATMGTLDFNAAGQVVFSAEVIGPGVDATNATGIWLDAPGSPPAVLARAGAAGPGPNVGPGIHFSSFGDPVLGSGGKAAFVGALTGPGIGSSNELGIWSNRTGVLAPLARAGATGPGPGVGAGVNFAEFGNPQTNANGDVAFTARVTGTGVNVSNDFGIWATLNGSLVTVAREGSLFDVQPGPGVTMRTISSVNFLNFTGGAGNEDGRHLAFNDNGLLTFQLFFTDGSAGVFTALVPEPTGMALLAPAAGILVRRRRRA